MGRRLGGWGGEEVEVAADMVPVPGCPGGRRQAANGKIIFWQRRKWFPSAAAEWCY